MDKLEMLGNIMKNIVSIKKKNGVYIFKIKLKNKELEEKQFFDFYYQELMSKIEMIDFSYTVILPDDIIEGYIGVRSLLGTDCGFLEHINLGLYDLYAVGITYAVSQGCEENSIENMVKLQSDIKYHRFCNFTEEFCYDDPLKIIRNSDPEWSSFYRNEKTKFGRLTAMYLAKVPDKLLLTYLFNVYLFINGFTVQKGKVLREDKSYYGSYAKILQKAGVWFTDLKDELPMQMFSVNLLQFVFQEPKMEVKKKIIKNYGELR